MRLTTGPSAAAVLPRLGDFAKRGLLDAVSDRYRASDLGFRFLNDLIAAFLPEENPRRDPAELYTAPSRFVSDRDFHHFVSEVP
jgi:hypothetical protein